MSIEDKKRLFTEVLAKVFREPVTVKAGHNEFGNDALVFPGGRLDAESESGRYEVFRFHPWEGYHRLTFGRAVIVAVGIVAEHLAGPDGNDIDRQLCKGDHGRG